METKPTSSSSSSQLTVTATCSQLPDDCWESIFRFILNGDDENRNKLSYLNHLSLVSKQFLSVTDRLRFSLTVSDSDSVYLHRIFKRFINLNSLEIKSSCTHRDKLLRKISRFPLKQLRSLSLSNQPNIPTYRLRAFSQKITTLTSLNCSNVHFLYSSDLFLIAECFPLLEELDLSFPSHCKNSASYVDGVEALSLALIKLRKVNLNQFPINNQSLFHLFNNCKHLEEVIMFGCDEITSAGLASAIRQRPTLRSLSFSTKKRSNVFPTSQFIDSLVSLKGLTCLVLDYLNISDELLYSIAREGLPLTRLDLKICTNYSYDGIFSLLSKCRHIQHLNLKYADFLNDQHVVQLSSFLGDLVSINLSGCDKLTELALFALPRNCPSLSEIKMERIGSESDIVGNSDSLGKFGVYPQLKGLYLGDNSWLSDEILIMVTSVFPNLQLLDLEFCNQNHISEGICQVLRKCCKIRNLNLAYCSRVKLHRINFAVPKLEVLNLSCTEVDDETLYLISKNCSELLQLQLNNCSGVTKKGVKCVLENCRQLREHGCITPPSHVLQSELSPW
ncbi:F-box/LRR-repeat protein [Trifolium repens]|nr:F-box/LRR-repeat protein [Trifolium repens]